MCKKKYLIVIAILVKYLDIAFSVVRNNRSNSIMKFLVLFFDDTVTNLFVLFQLEDQVDVTTELFQYCLVFTLMHRIAPLWNRVGDCLVQGKTFSFFASMSWPFFLPTMVRHF